MDDRTDLFFETHTKPDSSEALTYESRLRGCAERRMVAVIEVIELEKILRRSLAAHHKPPCESAACNLGVDDYLAWLTRLWIDRQEARRNYTARIDIGQYCFGVLRSRNIYD